MTASFITASVSDIVDGSSSLRSASMQLIVRRMLLPGAPGVGGRAGKDWRDGVNEPTEEEGAARTDAQAERPERPVIMRADARASPGEGNRVSGSCAATTVALGGV